MLVEDRELLFRQMEFPFVAAGEYNERELTRDEKVQLISFLVAMVRVRENQWLQYQNGVIDEATWYPVQVLLSTGRLADSLVQAQASSQVLVPPVGVWVEERDEALCTRKVAFAHRTQRVRRRLF